MADHDQKVDNKIGQNDKNLIQDVAKEVKDKDKSQTQNDIEARIEEGYIKLKGDINSRLTPLIQALTEAGVDSGLLASVEKEIHSNSRMSFFTRVMNSDINDMEEIRRIVQKESLQYLKPLFEEGEINHDEIKIAPEYSKEKLESSLLNLFNKTKENNEDQSLINQLQKDDAYEKAFGKDANPDDKKAAMALYIIATYSSKIFAGKLTSIERAMIEKALNDLRDFGEQYRDSIEDVERVLEGLPIKDVEADNIVLLNNFKDADDMRIQEYINNLANDIDLAREQTPEQQTELLGKLRTDKYGIDAIGKYFLERGDKSAAFSELEKKLVATSAQILDDKDLEIDLDGFAGAQMIETLIACYQHDSTLYKTLLESYNGRVGQEQQISDEMIKKAYENPSIMRTVWQGDIDLYYGQDGLRNMHERFKSLVMEKSIETEEPQFIVSPEYLQELDRQDAEREAQERDVSQITPEQKKENMMKAMTGMTKSRGLVKSQEWMDNLVTKYPDKELIAEAVVEFLEKQKETDEHFMDEDSKDARESVFESIVLTGIKNPEIFERMQKIDRETSKVVVKNVIEQVNSSRSVLNNVVSAIQVLGKNLNEPEKEVEQEQLVEDKPIGFLKADIKNMEKPDMFGGNNSRGEEHEDDWIR